MKNIIITGGELFNKGAQAMTFVAVDECKKRFPNHKIYVLSEMDLRRSKEDKDQYAFRFAGWYPVKFANCQTSPMLRTMCLLRNGKELRECEALYKNCDLMIDVSGYGLGSNFGPNQLSNYINHLEFAKAFKIPYYLMPQSFGPFDFDGEKKNITENLPDLLRSVKLICAREKEGYKALTEEYQLHNVRILPDIVLNNKGITLSNIYKKIPTETSPVVTENSIALVPNERIASALGKDSAIELYKTITAFLLNKGRKVYIISHASADQTLCREIKDSFPAENLIHLDKDFTCLEYNELVKRFRFVIASRFHAIVHAYKNSVPCIAVGWADKYRNLLAEFEQERFAFDVRSDCTINQIEDQIRYLDEHTEEESARIKMHLAKIQENNVFDLIEL